MRSTDLPLGGGSTLAEEPGQEWVGWGDGHVPLLALGAAGCVPAGARGSREAA